MAPLFCPLQAYPAKEPLTIRCASSTLILMIQNLTGGPAKRNHRIAGHRSLEEIHGTVEVPPHAAGFWRQWRAYVGPALLVSVGYMDPGNWGTDLAGGAQFKYDLLWVVALASTMAIFLQAISARLGIVTGKDLAQ